MTPTRSPSGPARPRLVLLPPKPKHRSAGPAATGAAFLVLSVILLAIVGAAALGWVDMPGILPAPAALSAPIVPTTGALAYSVAIGTFRAQEWDVVRTLIATISGVEGVFAISAWVMVDGTFFHRVLAGPAIDSASADALADRIAAETGEDRSDWVVRETPLSFLLGEMADMEFATFRRNALRRLSVPVYVLAIDYSDGSTRYRVYAGAYSDEREASYLRRRIEALGLDDITLSIRLGRLP